MLTPTTYRLEPFVHLKRPKREGLEQAIIENIDKQTVVVAIGNVHWADGTLFDLKPIRRACDENPGVSGN
ncbi:MAG: hypothetical protein R2769_15645 [Saprospiraceae bacterium]